MKSTISPRLQDVIIAHDTLQPLNYAKRLAFDTLWEPTETISINVKAIEKKRILGDEHLESIIKTRPGRYMVPSVSLDNIQDKDKRKLLIDFTYKTTANQAAKEVWNNFQIQGPCLSMKRAEESEKLLIDHKVISSLPSRFQIAARKWDSMQHRFFLDDIHHKKSEKDNQLQNCVDKKRSEKEHIIKKLINEDKLSIIYDKLPMSYKGYRPHTAYGVPLQEREI